MACPQVQTLMSEQLDGEIQARERELLEIHAAECADCRTALRDWVDLDRRLNEGSAEGRSRPATSHFRGSSHGFRVPGEFQFLPARPPPPVIRPALVRFGKSSSTADGYG